MRLFGVWVGLLVVACGGGALEGEDPATPASMRAGAPPAPPAPTEVTSSPAPRALRREDVKQHVRAGLGHFLQRVSLDDQPAFEGGRFKGFRVKALQGDPAFWQGVDLRPGDVVTRVNGRPIERPEQALEVFHSLATAPELRVNVERDGKPRDIVLPIEDQNGAGPAAPPAAPVAAPMTPGARNAPTSEPTLKPAKSR